MVARDIADMFPKRSVTARHGHPAALENLSSHGKYQDISLTLRRGEVLGLTGLLGSGAKDLIRTLFGLESATAGTIKIDGKPARSANPAQAVDQHLALVPEDRRGNGVALDLSVTENITLSSLKRFTRLGFLDFESERQRADESDPPPRRSRHRAAMRWCARSPAATSRRWRSPNG